MYLAIVVYSMFFAFKNFGRVFSNCLLYLAKP